MVPQIIRMPGPQELAQETARRFVAFARQAVEAHGDFRVALSGGSTPKALFETLARSPYDAQVDWDRIQVFFSDERFVPPDSPESNYHTAHVALLSKVAIPERHVHRIATVDITPQSASSQYEEEIRRVFEVGNVDVPRFDLILLGLGPDGHTASLFPGTEALGEKEQLVVPNYVPKFDSWRITFTYRLINAATNVAFLSQGSDKAERVKQVVSGDPELPASGVQPTSGVLYWMIDADAASQLPASAANISTDQARK